MLRSEENNHPSLLKRSFLLQGSNGATKGNCCSRLLQHSQYQAVGTETELRSATPTRASPQRNKKSSARLSVLFDGALKSEQGRGATEALVAGMKFDEGGAESVRVLSTYDRTKLEDIPGCRTLFTSPKETVEDERGK